MSAPGYVQLVPEQIQSLLAQIQDDPQALRAAEHCRQALKGHTLHNIVVDRWPDWGAVIFPPTTNQSQEGFAYLSNVIFVHGKDPGCLQALFETEGLIDWNKNWMFSALNVKLLPALRAVADACKGQVGGETMCQLYTVSQQALDKIDISLPCGYTEGQLSISDAEQVNREWKFGQTCQSLQYIRYLIRTFPSVSVYDPAGELVGYELAYPYGDQGMLHVDPAHRRKGLGKYVTVSLSRKIWQQGMVPFVYIEESETVSIKLHQACGFTALEDFHVRWIRYTPPGDCCGNYKPTCCV